MYLVAAKLTKMLLLFFGGFFAAELLSRYLEYFRFHHCSWQHHRDNCGFAGEQLPRRHPSSQHRDLQIKKKKKNTSTQIASFHDSLSLSKFPLRVTIPASQTQLKSCCDDFRHLCFTSCLSLLSACSHPPSIHSRARPSR